MSFRKSRVLVLRPLNKQVRLAPRLLQTDLTLYDWKSFISVMSWPSQKLLGIKDKNISSQKPVIWMWTKSILYMPLGLTLKSDLALQSLPELEDSFFHGETLVLHPTGKYFHRWKGISYAWKLHEFSCILSFYQPAWYNCNGKNQPWTAPPPWISWPTAFNLLYCSVCVTCYMLSHC